MQAAAKRARVRDAGVRCWAGEATPWHWVPGPESPQAVLTPTL